MNSAHRILRMVNAHLRVGYMYGLLAFDVVAIGCIAWDFLWFKLANRRISVALSLLSDLRFGQVLLPMACILVLALVVIPVLLAMARIAFGGERFDFWIVGRTGRLPVVAHVLATIAICAALLVETKMPVLAGYSLLQDQTIQASFTPLVLQGYTWSVAFVGGTLIVVAVQYLLQNKISFKDLKQYLRRYKSQLDLADVGGDLYPTGSRFYVNVNTGAIAPELSLVKRRVARILAKYQRSVPGSAQAAKYLNSLNSEVRTLIERVLFESEGKRTVELFAGTSRALEVALAKIPGRKAIVLSPYEHHSEYAVSKWIGSVCGCPVYPGGRMPLFGATRSDDEIATFAASVKGWLDGQPTDEVSDPASAVAAPRKVMSKTVTKRLANTETFVFVVSDVCYANGMLIPVESMVKAMRAVAQGRKFVVIVDGAHAIGNNKKLCGDAFWDYYIISGHKWLMSSEPCGILISNAQSVNPSVPPYDAWGQLLPATTVSVRGIAGLHASLSMIDKYGFEFFWTRAKALRDELLRLTHDRFQVLGVTPEVQNGDQGLMIALRPHSEWQWREDEMPALRSQFERSRVSLHLESDLDEGICARLSFPHYLGFDSIRKVARVLRAAITTVPEEPGPASKP